MAINLSSPQIGDSHTESWKAGELMAMVPAGFHRAHQPAERRSCAKRTHRNLLQGLVQFWLQRDRQWRSYLPLDHLSSECCLELGLMPMTLAEVPGQTQEVVL